MLRTWRSCVEGVPWTEGTPTPSPVLVSVDCTGDEVVCFDIDSRDFVSVESKGFTAGLFASAEYKEVAGRR
jgi:hypothetical protein